jgi:hypothetical protein
MEAGAAEQWPDEDGGSHGVDGRMGERRGRTRDASDAKHGRARGTGRGRKCSTNHGLIDVETKLLV